MGSLRKAKIPCELPDHVREDILNSAKALRTHASSLKSKMTVELTHRSIFTDAERYAATVPPSSPAQERCSVHLLRDPQGPEAEEERRYRGESKFPGEVQCLPGVSGNEAAKRHRHEVPRLLA